MWNSILQSRTFQCALWWKYDHLSLRGRKSLLAAPFFVRDLWRQLRNRTGRSSFDFFRQFSSLGRWERVEAIWISWLTSSTALYLWYLFVNQYKYKRQSRANSQCTRNLFQLYWVGSQWLIEADFWQTPILRIRTSSFIINIRSYHLFMDHIRKI